MPREFFDMEKWISLSRFLIFSFILILNSILFYGSSTPKKSLSLADLQIKQTVDWEKGLIYLDIIAPILENRDIFPVNRIDTERFIAQNFYQIIQKNISSIYLNSTQTIGDYFKENPKAILALQSVYQDTWRNYSQVSPDFKTLNIHYSLPIYPNLVEIFINHVNMFDSLFFVNNAIEQESFTGIVIYIKKDLDLAESIEGKSNFNPSLFPKIYDSHLNLFFEKEMVKPEFIKKWGVISYTKDPLLIDQKERIGENPFYLAASSLYGVNTTDIILTNQDVMKLTSFPSNKKLIEEGRIVFVLED